MRPRSHHEEVRSGDGDLTGDGAIGGYFADGDARIRTGDSDRAAAAPWSLVQACGTFEPGPQPCGMARPCRGQWGAWGASGLVLAAEFTDRGTGPGPNQVDRDGERAEEQERGDKDVTSFFGRAAHGHSRGTRVPGTARGERPLDQALALRLGEGTSSLLVQAGFMLVDATGLKLYGPSEQEAGAAAYSDDFVVYEYLGSTRAPAVVWSEADQGLQMSLRAILSRQLNGRGGRRLEVGDWQSLRRWARQRSRVLADRHPAAARRRAAQQVGRLMESRPGSQNPGLLWGEDMTHAARQVPRGAVMGGMKGAPGLTGRGPSMGSIP